MDDISLQIERMVASGKITKVAPNEPKLPFKAKPTTLEKQTERTKKFYRALQTVITSVNALPSFEHFKTTSNYVSMVGIVKKVDAWYTSIKVPKKEAILKLTDVIVCKCLVDRLERQELSVTLQNFIMIAHPKANVPFYVHLPEDAVTKISTIAIRNK